MTNGRRQVLDRRKDEDKNSIPCSWCRRCANYGFGCIDYIYITKEDERIELAFYGQLSRPDCFERD